MYCPYCRMALKDGATRCDGCGMPVIDGAPAAAAAMTDARIGGGGSGLRLGLVPPAGSQSPIPQMVAQTSTASYAGFWLRLGALVLDSIILTAATIILVFFYRVVLSPDTNGNVGHRLVLELILFLLEWFYFAGMESGPTQATLGKMAFGIIVTDTEGRNISFGRATGRYFAKVLSAFIVFIGYIMAAFTPRKQALHDYIAGTLVIREP